MIRIVVTLIKALLASAIITDLTAQNLFHKQIDLGNGNAELIDARLSTLPLSDGYVIAVQQKNPSILYVLKYDVCDELQWQKNFAFDGIKDIAVSEDKVFVINHSSLLTYFVKSDVATITKFNRSNDFTGSTSIELYTVDTYIDGSFMLVGFDSDSLKAFAIKQDSDLNVLWSRYYFNWANNSVCGRATSNGELYIKLTNFPFDIYRIDSEGNYVQRNSIYNRNGFSTTVCPREFKNGFVHVFSIDSTSNEYKVAFLKNLKVRSDWTSQSFKSQKLKEICYLPGTGDIAILGSEYAEGSTITFIDSTGRSISQITSEKSLEETQYFDMSVINESYLLIVGIELDSSNQKKLSVRKMAGISKKPICGFKDTIISDTIRQFSYGTGSYWTSPDSAIFKKSFNAYGNSFQANELQYCFENNPIQIEFDIGHDTTLCSDQFPIEVVCDKNFPVYNWSNGETSKSIIVDKPGTYWLSAGYDCSSFTDTIKISEYPPPVFKYNVYPKSPSPVDLVKMRSFSSNVDSVAWYINGSFYSNNLIDSIQLERNGEYLFEYQLRDIYGCYYRDSTLVRLNWFNIYVPNTFSPNQDGINDIFEPVGFGLLSYQIVIYNQWGEIIFEAENEPWDGGKSPEGMYAYYINILKDDKTEFESRGKIFLIR